MEKEPKPKKEEVHTIGQTDPAPKYKNERPISTKEEAVATLEKSIEGNSWNQIEVLPGGEVVIAVYVMQGYPDHLEAIYYFRLEKEVFNTLKVEKLLREFSEENTFGHGWGLKLPEY